MIPWLTAGAIVVVGLVVGGIAMVRVLAMVGESDSDGEIDADEDQLDEIDSSWFPMAHNSGRAPTR